MYENIIPDKNGVHKYIVKSNVPENKRTFPRQERTKTETKTVKAKNELNE